MLQIEHRALGMPDKPFLAELNSQFPSVDLQRQCECLWLTRDGGSQMRKCGKETAQILVFQDVFLL